MICLARQADWDDWVEFCRRSPFGARILSFAEGYGLTYDFANFWLQRVDDAVCAVLARIDGTATLYASSCFDAEEAARFLLATGYESLFCEERAARDMRLSIREGGPVLCHCGDPSALRSVPPADLSFSDSPLPQALFLLLTQVGMLPEESRMGWITDVSHRIRHGTVRAVCLLSDGRPVSCAMEVARTPDCIMIGAVATHPAFRGRGYGSWLVSHLTEDALLHGKAVYLCRAEQENQKFYQALGFRPFSRWAVC